MKTLNKEKQKILVTGGCGFIGSNFINFVTDNFDDYIVYNIDSLTYAANVDYIKDKRVKSYYFDITETDKLYDIFINEGPFDYIFNFAAESHVDRSIEDPQIFVKSNVLGTQNLLDCFHNQEGGRFIHISTDEVYGHLNYSDPTFTEETPLNPRSPYSASKAGSDLLALSYFSTYRDDVIVTRCCNNFGRHQHKEKFIPTIINKIVKNEKVPVYGDGLNIREWIYVDDHVDAIWFIAKNGTKGDVYNIGTGRELANIEIVDEICKILNKGLDESVIFVKDRPGHDFRYGINCNKLRDLGWEPKYDDCFIENLKKTVDYYVNS